MEHHLDRGNSALRSIHVYSGHDVSVLALLSALQLDDAVLDPLLRSRSHPDPDKDASSLWVWPEYAAAMTLELYEDEAVVDTLSNHRWFVRATFNGRSIFRKHSHPDKKSVYPKSSSLAAPLRKEENDAEAGNPRNNQVEDMIPWTLFRDAIRKKVHH